MCVLVVVSASVSSLNPCKSSMCVLAVVSNECGERAAYVCVGCKCSTIGSICTLPMLCCKCSTICGIVWNDVCPFGPLVACYIGREKPPT
jgi:hypothetical protein